MLVCTENRGCPLPNTRITAAQITAERQRVLRGCPPRGCPHPWQCVLRCHRCCLRAVDAGRVIGESMPLSVHHSHRHFLTRDLPPTGRLMGQCTSCGYSSCCRCGRRCCGLHSVAIAPGVLGFGTIDPWGILGMPAPTASRYAQGTATSQARKKFIRIYSPHRPGEQRLPPPAIVATATTD